MTAGGHWAAADWLAFNLALRSADSEAGYPNGFGPLGIPADEPNEGAHPRAVGHTLRRHQFSRR